MTIKDKIIMYLYHKSCRLEQEKENNIEIVRRRAVDSLDMYEIMRSKIRISACEEILNDIYNIVLGSSQIREDK